MPVRYGWRPGSRVELDAQKAGEALARLEKRHNGLLEPETIVVSAKNAASALHGHFEWDDSVAAGEYRKDQARELVRSLTIDISRSNVEPAKPIRAYVSVESGGERGYASVATAMSSIELRRQVIARAWAELEAWRQRHAELVELGRVFSMIDQGPPEAAD
jgi:hypothetical protein